MLQIRRNLDVFYGARTPLIRHLSGDIGLGNKNKGVRRVSYRAGISVREGQLMPQE